MPTVSVVLATYNGQRYLEAQLKTIARQTVPPAELIVSDDGSTDATMTLVHEFAETAAFPVRILQNPVRLGYRRNFMQAAAASQSELIAFCDQDDLWEPDKLANMAKPFADAEVLLAYHNATLIGANGGRAGTTFRRRSANTSPPLTMRPWLIIPGLVQVVRQSLLRLTSLHAASIDPYEPCEAMPHDQWYPFWASVLGKIAYVPESLAHYRQHDANASGWPAHLLAYVVDHIRHAERYVAGNAIGARNRLQLLQGSREFLTGAEIARIDAAIPYYQALSAESDRRLAVYRGLGRRARARTLAALLREGAYTNPKSNSLGLDALLLDAGIGVPFARLGRSRQTPSQPGT